MKLRTETCLLLGLLVLPGCRVPFEESGTTATTGEIGGGWIEVDPPSGPTPSPGLVASGAPAPWVVDPGSDRVEFSGRAFVAPGKHHCKGDFFGPYDCDPGVVVRWVNIANEKHGKTKGSFDASFLFFAVGPNEWRDVVPVEPGTNVVRFEAADDQGRSAAVEVEVLVPAEVPVALPRDVATEANTPVTFRLKAQDASGHPVTFQVIAPPAYGSLSGPSAAPTYTPGPDFVGTDTFSFTADDGTTVSSPATVTITVGPR
jgi:hypothetical protein